MKQGRKEKIEERGEDRQVEGSREQKEEMEQEAGGQGEVWMAAP